MIKLGIIGTGGIAQNHMRNVHNLGAERVRFVAYCDVVLEKAEAAAKQYGGTAYADFTEMLDKESLDAVFICTPPFVRVEPIVAAADRRLPIFCEKPPAFDAEAGGKALNAIERAGVVSSVGFMYRWLKIVDRAKSLLEGRRIIAIRSNFLNPPALDLKLPGWFYQKERSGGPLMDQAIHMLDLQRYFAGEATSVHALGNNQIRAKSDTFTIEETCTLNIQYDSGVIGTHTHSWVSRHVTVEFEIISDEAHLVLSLHNNRLTGTIDGAEIQYAPGDVSAVTEVDGFLKALETGDSSLIRSPFRDGLGTCAVTWAGLASIEKGNVETPARF